MQFAFFRYKTDLGLLPYMKSVTAPGSIRLSFGVVFNKRQTWVPSVTSTVGDAQGVVNRDIKLENTLLDQSRRPLIKICDFGYSKHLQKDSVPKSRVGTPGYTGFPHLCASQGLAIQSTLLVCSDPEPSCCTGLCVLVTSLQNSSCRQHGSAFTF